MYVINPLEKDVLKSFFDDQSIEVIKYFIIKSLFSQPEVLPSQNPLPVQIPKEHIEQWFTQALNVKPVGAGSFPIDIYNTENRWGADIKMLAVKQDSDGNILNADSGEASLGQNFREAGLELDSLFSEGRFEEIKDLWLTLYKNKFDAVQLRYPVDKFYYFFILRSGPTFYLTGASVNLDNLSSVTVNVNRSTARSSVYLSGLIDESLGNAKIYKAKKRLELRLRPRVWIESNYAMQFKTNFVSVVTDLRSSVSNPEFMDDMLERFKNLDMEIL